jgi:hypothetical protein
MANGEWRKAKGFFESDVDSASARRLPGGGTMKYLCLIYDEENKVYSLPQNELQRLMDEYSTFTRAVRQTGHYLGGNDLEPVLTATTVRVRNGKISTTDGPFAETKEQLGGYCLIEARDLNEAIQVASRIPSAKLGCIEVRPVREHPEM